MKLNSYKSPMDCSTIVTAKIGDVELLQCLSPEFILADVRKQISNRLADLVMQKLEPAIVNALAEIKEEISA